MINELRPEVKEALFRANWYTHQIPPVDTIGWKTTDWIKWIDAFGRWEVEPLNKVKRKYTTAIHVVRLEAMLRAFSRPERCCPATYAFSGRTSPADMWARTPTPTPCDICRKFVGINKIDRYACPCQVMGKEEALWRGRLAINCYKEGVEPLWK